VIYRATALRQRDDQNLLQVVPAFRNPAVRLSTPKQPVYRLVIAAAIDANTAAIVFLASTALPSGVPPRKFLT